MNAYHLWLNSLVNANKSKFSAFNIKWLNPYEAEFANQKKENFIKQIPENWLFKKTKPYHQQISLGCKLCGMGSWSCLFITNKCNAKCFYCPAPQLNDEVPSTQQLTFPTPESYAEYINYFGFKGVSFSGGEPLLFFERVMNYLKAIRKKCKPEIYIWMYTNGILGDEKKYRKLAQCGLNEIRFDIGATGFRIDKVKLAKGIIPNITIEIPAVPEEKEKLKQLLPEMIAAGVSNLNLHQLRLTLHNAPQLSKRKYTFIHAEQPLVLESELAALEILNYAREKHLNIGINYCSFHFKNRFQKAGFRKQLANTIASPNDFITENGFIREKTDNKIIYRKLSLTDCSTNTREQEILTLKNKNYQIKKEVVLQKDNLSVEEKELVEKLIENPATEVPENPLLFKIWQMEYIENGLREY